MSHRNYSNKKEYVNKQEIILHMPNSLETHFWAQL